ncbi:molybdate ABC transporter substrate-binding protein [Nakamurella antarctica]
MSIRPYALVALLAATAVLTACSSSDAPMVTLSPAASSQVAAPAASSASQTSTPASSAGPTSSAAAAATPTSAASTASGTTSEPATASGAPVAAGTITVFAAASLKKTFTEIGEQFKAANPGSDVIFSFAGSSDLVTQLIGGAPADVFASADTKNMTKATEGGVTEGTPVNFATNTLTIVVPPTNPAGITSFADLAKPGLNLVICAPQVPCGSAAKKVADASGITLSPVSEESSVTDVLNKVTAGEADAGLVYVTDASGAGDKVATIAFPESSSAVNTYPIVAIKGSTQAALAAKFIELVKSAQGQKVLSASGFAPAP